MRGFNYRKAVQALNLLAKKKGGTLNKMKAIKLIWLADRFHIRKYGRSITGDDYYALPNGPVPSGIRDILENSGFLDDTATEYASEYISIIDKYNFKTLAEPNIKVFSETDINALEIIYENFGDMEHFALSDLSHLFPEWKKHESALQKRISSRFPINQSDFFINIDEKSKLFIDCNEDLLVSKEIFEENSEIMSIF